MKTVTRGAVKYVCKDGLIPEIKRPDKVIMFQEERGVD